MADTWVVYQSREPNSLKTYVELIRQRKISFTYDTSTQYIKDASGHNVLQDKIENFADYSTAFARFISLVEQKDKEISDREERVATEEREKEERRKADRERTKELNKKMAEENKANPKPKQANKKAAPEKFELDL